ncbi:hypothetical protein [Microbacterium sp. CJ88]|uniref:hypothetical protein n=1 Tax=Microbacterium sp. CJ88 TaxID=3445672 RepID=UPI003F65BB86
MTTRSPERRFGGLTLILIATAVAGAVGYVIQLLAPALLGDAEAYLGFSVFWSTLYLFVSAIAGVQQEVTRATHPSPTPSRSTTLRTVTLAGGAVLVVVAVIVGLLLGPGAFSAAPVALTAWFAVGIVGYLLSAVLAGVLYGLELWREIALLTVADALIRGILTTIALVLHAPPAILGGAIATPFVLAFGLVWLVARHRVVGRFALDVAARRLLVNTSTTVLAAAATGAMVTGLPLLLRSTMPDVPAVALASLVMAITITRAPLIVPLMALQSYLIVEFRKAGTSLWPRLARYLAVAVAVAALAAVLGGLLGPWVVDVFSGGKYAIDAWTGVVVVVSAGLVSMMCLTGPALLSEARHGVYVSGWAVAALATVALLLLPVPTGLRIDLALIAPALVGLIVHLGGIRRPGGTPRAQGAPEALG